ncbi:dGTP triphosphohydrolase [Draconibacterium orientale]|uniref:deoxyguanosinetriphosphate triphosphohydrolase family protein n=1 Tax=Draconibacterium orientale TaxID=1168034 RepID=UPI002ABDA8FD|nr:dNTP triphosphohydrolase [Draconibacterium orientale]
MTDKKFYDVRITSENTKWSNSVGRINSIYQRPNDIRSDFARDYTRILHSNGYRRLKTKTQVFFATKSDHICTRIEHVNHVASVSSTIAKHLGLNEELVSAIAIGHDVGHAPFGHHGETVLKRLAQENIKEGTFWHEKNSLFFLDNIETLKDEKGNSKNLNLTYAVRDGIISHCGEVNENAIFPRTENIELDEIEKANQYQPYTWEGCVVKIADKIAYLGRDIEDAMYFRILNFKHYKELRSIIAKHLNNDNLREINNGILIHGFIMDLLDNSSPDKGINLSENYLGLMNDIKAFNYRVIYKYWRIEQFKNYATLIIETIFKTLMRYYDLNEFEVRIAISRRNFPSISHFFEDWLVKYSNINPEKRKKKKYVNRIIYDVQNKESFAKCCVDFISGMTDSFAIKCYNEIISF